ncbi:MAG: hypothetical protein ACRC6F_02550, partial [Aeromonas sp.]
MEIHLITVWLRSTAGTFEWLFIFGKLLDKFRVKCVVPYGTLAAGFLLIFTYGVMGTYFPSNSFVCYISAVTWGV